MLRVKDSFGNIVPGLLKNNLGNIVVNTPDDYDKYKREIESQNEIKYLRDEVAQLKLLVKSFICKQ